MDMGAGSMQNCSVSQQQVLKVRGCLSLGRLVAQCTKLPIAGNGTQRRGRLRYFQVSLRICTVKIWHDVKCGTITVTQSDVH